MTEQSIQRYVALCQLPKEDERGAWVRYEDHLAALGEKDLMIRVSEEHTQHWEAEARATLTADITKLIDHLDWALRWIDDCSEIPVEEDAVENPNFDKWTAANALLAPTAKDGGSDG